MASPLIEMQKDRIKYIIPILLILLSNIYILFLYKPKSSLEMAKILQMFPRKVGEWIAIEDIKMDSYDKTVLEPSSLVFRKYENEKKDAVWLCIVYHQNDRWGAHDPQVCYRSQGWTLSNYGGRDETTKISFKELNIEVNQFYVEKEAVRELVLYWWFAAEGEQMGSRFDQICNMIYTGIFKGYLESGFVRVSIILEPGKEEEDKKTAISFAREVSKVLKRSFPK